LKNVRWFHFLLVVTLVFSASGCTLAVVGGGLQTWQWAREDRSFKDLSRDSSLFSDLWEAFGKGDSNLAWDVVPSVFEGEVLLAGTVKSGEVRERAERIVREDSRTQLLHNEIVVVDPEEVLARRREAQTPPDLRRKASGGSYVQDFWIQVKIRVKLLSSQELSAINYRYRSVLGQVYVIGRAPNQEEHEKALQIIRNTDGVKSVKSFVRIESPVPRKNWVVARKK
jgi:osmotically-inducible protein OsmY